MHSSINSLAPGARLCHYGYVTGEMRTSPTWSDRLERLPLDVHPLVAITVTLLLCGVGLVARIAIFETETGNLPFVTFFLGVLAACFLFGARYGLLGAVVSVILAIAYALPGSPLRGLIASIPFALTIGVNILFFHLMQRANRRLREARERNEALARTRTLLFNELQHRVSNNLQVAAALLALQKRNISDPATAHAIDEASRRLALIGRISRQLYSAEGKARDLADFIEPLCRDIIDASGATHVDCGFDVADRIDLPPNSAVPLALIVAEAVANALEHGFQGRQQGAIRVAIRRAADAVEVTISDDGHGLPATFDLGAQAGLGLRIASTLAGQLGGRFEMRRGDVSGTVALLSLPA